MSGHGEMWLNVLLALACLAPLAGLGLFWAAATWSAHRRGAAAAVIAAVFGGTGGALLGLVIGPVGGCCWVALLPSGPPAAHQILPDGAGTAVRVGLYIGPVLGAVLGGLLATALHFRPRQSPSL